MSSHDEQKVLLQNAFELIQSGQKLQASKIISRVLQANPNNADGWYLAALATENVEKKARLLERALEINPRYIEARKLLDELDEGSLAIDNLLRETEPVISNKAPPPAAYKPPAPKPAAPTSFMRGSGFWAVVGVLVVLILLGGLWAVGQARGELLGIVFRASETPTITPTPTIKPTLPPTWTLTPTATETATATSTATPTDPFDVTATAYAQFNNSVMTAVVQTQAASALSNPPTLSVSNANLIPTWTPFLYPSNTPSATPENLINSTVTRLDFRIIAAEYSASLRRIIAISDSPNQLHIYDPVKNTDVTVDLPRVPTSVGVQPDGLFAAVGHDALISYVDLQNARLVKTLDINQRVGHLALAGNGWVYTVPDGGQWVPMGAVKISTGEQLEGPRVWGENILRIYQNGQKIYGANRGTSPDDIFRINLSADTGIAAADLEGGYPLDSPYHGDYYMCGDLWLSQDGQRIFTACGSVFRSSDAPGQDMTYNGSVHDLPAMGYMFHSQAAGIVLGLSLESGRGINLGGPFVENKMAVWDYQNLTLRKMVILPDFSITGSPYPAHGRYVFVNPEGTEYYVIVQVDSAAAQINDFGLIVGKVSDISP